MEWQKEEFLVTCDPAKADFQVISGFLSESYWAKNIPPAIVQKSLENSLTFNFLKGQNQIGFARVISDFATIGYLGDVFVLPEYRARGLGREVNAGVRVRAPRSSGIPALDTRNT